MGCHIKPDDADSELRALANSLSAILAANPEEKDIILRGDFNADGRYLDEQDLAQIFPSHPFHVVIANDGNTMTTSDNTYDTVGNLTDDAENYEYVYDPFGRLRTVKNTSTQAPVAEYTYGGLGHRIGWHYDVDADGTVEDTSDDPCLRPVFEPSGDRPFKSLSRRESWLG